MHYGFPSIDVNPPQSLDQQAFHYRKGLQTRDSIGTLRTEVITNTQPESLAHTLNDSGIAFFTSNRYEEALEAFYTSLSHSSTFNASSMSSIVNYNIGLTLYRLQRYPQAVTAYQTSNESLLAGDTLQAAVCYNLAKAHRKLDEIDAAIQAYVTSCQVLEAHGFAKHRADALYGLGKVLEQKSLFEKAHRTYSKSLEIYAGLDQTSHGHRLLQTFQNNQSSRQSLLLTKAMCKAWKYFEPSTVLRLAADFQKRQCFQSAIAVSRLYIQRAENRLNMDGLAMALYKVGCVYTVLGNDASGVSAFNQSSTVCRSLVKSGQNPSGCRQFVMTLITLGTILLREFDTEESFAAYTEASDLTYNNHLTQERVWALNGLATLFKNTGDFELTEKAYTKCVELSRQLHLKQELAESLEKLGSVMECQRNFDKAAECYKQSLSLYRELDLKEELANVLYYVGLSFRSHNHYRKAVACFKEGLSLYQALDLRSERSIFLEELAEIAQKQGTYDLAIAIYEEYAALCQELADDEKQIEILNSLGDIYYKRGKYDQSLANSRKAIDLMSRLGRTKPNIHGECTRRISAVYLSTQQYEAVIKLYRPDHTCLTKYVGARECRDIALAFELQGNLEQASIWHSKCLTEISSPLTKEELSFALLDLAMLYDIAGQHSKALRFIQLRKALSKHSSRA